MHAVRTYKAVEVQSHSVLTSALREDKFTSGERPSVANEQKAGRVPEPIWVPPFRISNCHFVDISCLSHVCCIVRDIIGNWNISDEMLFYKICYFLILTHAAVTIQ